MATNSEARGTLNLGEPHPGYHFAVKYLQNVGLEKLFLYREVFASCAIENNRNAEICSETLRRYLGAEPISDRYIMGLAWYIYSLENKCS